MNSVLKTMAKLTALLSVMVFALPITAKTTQEASVGLPTYEPALENQRDPNQYCAQCHKFDVADNQAKGEFHAGKFYGIHLTTANPNTGKPITCVSCHGNISENHRRGVKDVMRFRGDIFSDEKPLYPVEAQNQVCFSCHQPDKLRETFWAHDVHAMKLPCASCHTLHPKQDAMRDILPKERVKLCVDCHGEQQKRLLEKSNVTEQKDKQ